MCKRTTKATGSRRFRTTLQQLEDVMNAKYGPSSRRYNLRNRREHDYLHLFATNNAQSNVDRSHSKRSADQETRRKAIGSECGSSQDTLKVAEHGTALSTPEENANQRSVLETPEDA